MAALGNACLNAFADGRHDLLHRASDEEANLLRAVRLGFDHGWSDAVLGALQGLRILYQNTGRWGSWARLVAEAKRLLGDPDADEDPAGREREWAMILDYEIDLARHSRDSQRQRTLLTRKIAWNRRSTAALVARPPETLSEDERLSLRTLGADLGRLGALLAQNDDADAIPALEEALRWYRHIGDRPAEAIGAFNLGHAYLNIDAVRDLDETERWYRTSLSLRSEDDVVGLTGCHGQLGRVALMRFRATRQPRHLEQARTSYLTALDLTPDTALAERAVIHTMLGNVFEAAGDTDLAVENFRDAIQCEELTGDRFGAGQSRGKLAALCLKHRRLSDARDYAEAALADFHSFDDHAADWIGRVEELLSVIEENLALSPSRW